MKKLFLLSLLCAVTFLFTSCKKNETASESDDKIYVIADSLEFARLYPIMDSVFGKIIYTPQPEKYFEIVRADYKQLEELKTSKNIIIAASLNSNGDVSKYVNSILGPKLVQKVNSGNEYAFNKYNLWTKNQLVLVLTAPSIDQLKNFIRDKSSNLLYYFQKVSNNQLTQNLYNRKYENIEAEAKLLKNYGWIIYVHTDYSVVNDSPADKFVCLKNSTGSEVERWIFIHWIDNATPDFLHPDSIINERNRMAEKFYRETNGYAIIAKNYKTTTEVNFLNRYALATQGLWEMSDKSKGGPFINYTFYDEITRRVYMLDGSIFAPRYIKKSLIQQVDVTLQSFLTERQLSDKRKKEYLSVLDNK